MALRHIDTDGSWVTEETSEDPALVKLCVTSFDAVWERGIPHEEYRPV